MGLEPNREMLAGVCSWLATRLHWNVWAIRAVLLILLVAQPVWTALGYVVAAVVLGATRRGEFEAWRDRAFPGRASASGNPTAELHSPELNARKQRIQDLEQRFRNWEKTLPEDR
jgi:phage shock protein PspC (stress-responsive transcriptional regulator)